MEVSTYRNLKIHVLSLAVMDATRNGEFSVAYRPVSLEPLLGDSNPFIAFTCII